MVKQVVDNKQNLGEGSVGKLLFQLAFPAILAQIVNVLYNMVDRMYIGRMKDVGAIALTGLGVCMPLVILTSAFAALAGMGGAPRAAIMLGKQKKEEAENILGNCTTLVLLISLVLTLVYLVFSPKLLMLFGASEQTISYALDYMRIYAMGTVFTQITIGLNSFITTQGFAKISMKTVLIGAVLNIVLDPIFIFVFGLGVKGAAIATVIAQAASACWVLRFLTGKQAVICIRRKYMKLSPKVFLPCLALGLSPFIMQSTESLLQIAFNSSLQRYGGDMAVGAMTILMTVMQLSSLPIHGLTQGAQPIISFNYGAGKPERVKKAFFLSLLAAFTYAFIFWALVMGVPQMFVQLFSKDPDLTKATIPALRIFMSMSCLFSIQSVCQQTFLALGNAKTSIFIAILRKIILLIPLIYILPLFMENQVRAVFLAEPIADFLSVCTTITLFFFYFRKTLKGMREQI